MFFYKIKFNTISEVKMFSEKILEIESEATMRTENRKYVIDAKSIMGIFSLDLSNNLILEMEENEEEFISEIKNMGIEILPLEV